MALNIRGMRGWLFHGPHSVWQRWGTQYPLNSYKVYLNVESHFLIWLDAKCDWTFSPTWLDHCRQGGIERLVPRAYIILRKDLLNIECHLALLLHARWEWLVTPSCLQDCWQSGSEFEYDFLSVFNVCDFLDFVMLCLIFVWFGWFFRVFCYDFFVSFLMIFF